MNEAEIEQFKMQLEALAIKIHAEVHKQFEDKFHLMKIGTPEAEMPQAQFQTVYAAMLMKIAAVLAIDSNIDRAKFNDLADESWNAAYMTAPKFS